MTDDRIKNLQEIRRLVWDLYRDPTFKNMQTLTHLCDKAIDLEIGGAFAQQPATHETDAHSDHTR